MKKFFPIIAGFLSGVLNGLLGAGGGMILVPILTKCGLDRKQAHATSVCIIFPLCVFSSTLYLYSGKVSFSDVTPYVVWGVLGAVIGGWILPKINQQLLRRVFGVFMIWAAYRMVF